MLSTDAFRSVAKNHVLFAHITTRIEGRADDDLLGRKGGSGFPYVVAMDARGRVLSRLADRTVDGVEAMMASARASLAKRDDPGITPADRVEFLVFDLGVGNVDIETARKTLAGMEGLSTDQSSAVENAMLNAEARGVMRTVKSAGDFAAAGEAFLAMAKAGRVPTDARLLGYFWSFQLNHAEKVGDADLYRSVMTTLVEMQEEGPRRDRVRAGLEKRLAALEERLAGE